MSYRLLGSMMTAMILWSATFSFAGDNPASTTTDISPPSADVQQSAPFSFPDIVWEEAGPKLESLAPIVTNGAQAPTATDRKSSGE